MVLFLNVIQASLYFWPALRHGRRRFISGDVVREPAPGSNATSTAIERGRRIYSRSADTEASGTRAGSTSGCALQLLQGRLHIQPRVHQAARVCMSHLWWRRRLRRLLCRLPCRSRPNRTFRQKSIQMRLWNVVNLSRKRRAGGEVIALRVTRQEHLFCATER